MTLKPIFNRSTCHLRREVILRHVAKLRKETDNVQRCMAEHPGISLETFQRRFNELERNYKHNIAKITLYEAEKTRN